MGKENLDQLLALAKGRTMSAQEKSEQRISFTYGNTNIENGRITRETVVRAAQKLSAKDG